LDYVCGLIVDSAFVVCSRKRESDGYARALEKAEVKAGALHGDMSQIKRTETLDEFKSGEIAVLVCSDVAARGIDISDVGHVLNMDLPLNAEDYIHRIGRTGRAGKTGEAYSFVCLPDDEKLLTAVEELVGQAIERIEPKKADQPEPRSQKQSSSKRKPNKSSSYNNDNDDPSPMGLGEDLPDFMSIGR